MSNGLIWVGVAVIVVIAFILGRRTKKKADAIFTETTSGGGTTADPDKDAWEGWFDSEEPKKVSAYLQIDYVDGEGKPSNRSIIVKQFDDNLYNGCILAHCEMRDANRTFRYDRIKKCIDIETGEVIPDVQTFLSERYLASPEHTLDKLLNDFYDVLRALFYVAKADGQFRKPEKVVVCEYLKKLTGDDRLTVDSVTDIFKGVELPSLHAFKIAVGKAVKIVGIDTAELFQCCKDIVGTQKNVTPSEQEALDYVEKRAAK